MIPTPYRILGLLAFVVATFVAGMLAGREQVQDKWDQAASRQLMQAAQAELANRTKEQSMLKKLNEAQNAATEREKKLRADYAAAHAAAIGLRDTVAALRSSLPGKSDDACRATADAALAVFGECQARYGALAEAADGHASDVLTLSEAWPE